MTNCRRHLLLIECSARKRSHGGLIPALERYDGGTYRVLRRAQREGYYPPGLTAMVLSARYGLIDIAAPVAYYDQQMEHSRAADLRLEVNKVLESMLDREGYDQVYIDLGANYLPAMPDLTTLFATSRLLYAQGRIGERLAHLKAWLRLVTTQTASSVQVITTQAIGGG